MSSIGLNPNRPASPTTGAGTGSPTPTPRPRNADARSRSRSGARARSRFRHGDPRLRAARLADVFLFLLAASVPPLAILAFGGAAWWSPAVLFPPLAVLALGVWVRMLAVPADRRLRATPVGALVALPLILAVVQLVPLPAPLVSRIAPETAAIHDLGVSPAVARRAVPDIEVPPVARGAMPLTLDRSATLRYGFAALGALTLCVAVSRLVDRLSRLRAILGVAIGAFGVLTLAALLQLAGDGSAFLGRFNPGAAVWLPSLGDLAAAPGFETTRAVVSDAGRVWLLGQIGETFHLATLVGGPDAYLALAAVMLPLMLGLILHEIAASRGRTGSNARPASGAVPNTAILLGMLAFLAALCVGAIGGRWMVPPFLLSAALVLVPASRVPHLGRSAAVLGLVVALGLPLGVLWRWSGDLNPLSAAAVERFGPHVVLQLWTDAARLGANHPVAGVGLGAFAGAIPFHKSLETTFTTPHSALVQYLVETGLLGAVPLAVLLLILFARIPAWVRSVGSLDRPLAYACLGALLGVGIHSCVDWSVQLPAVALAAALVAGVVHRWAGGGTDLFVPDERRD